MQDAYRATVEVGAAPMRVEQIRLGVQRDRHCVDRKSRRARSSWSVAGRTRAARPVARRTRPALCEVEVEPLERHLRGREALVPDRLTAEPAGQCLGVALDHDVEVGPLATQQEVPHDASDEVDRERAGRVANPLDAGNRVHELAQSGGIVLVGEAAGGSMCVS